MTPRQLRAGAVAIAAAVVLLATTFPVDDPEVRELTSCLVCGERGLADALLNLLLFLPLGAALAVSPGGQSRALFLAACYSMAIEALQLFVIAGRDPSLGDVLFNTLGAALGIALVAGARWWLTPTPRRARTLAWSWSTLTAAVILGTGWLLAPALPRTVYYGSWTPDFDHLAWYRGRVLDAHLGSERVASQRLGDSHRARYLLLAGVPITMQLIAGPAPHALAPIVIINDEGQREIVLVGQDRQDLVLRFRTRARSVQLDQPDFRMEGAMQNVRAGDTVRIMARLGDGGHCLRLEREIRCDIGMTAASGWTLLMYVEALPRSVMRMLSAGWMLLLFTPLGFWISLRWPDALAVLPAGLALIIAPLVTSQRPSSTSEIGVVLIAILIGSMLRRTVQHAMTRA